MSLSRSPSPKPEGGWATPGLTAPHNFTTFARQYPQSNGHKEPVTWASARARSAEVNGFPAFSPQGQSLFQRALRSISWAFPRVRHSDNRHYAEKEKLGLGRRQLSRRGGLHNSMSLVWKFLWRMRLQLMLLFILVYLVSLLYTATGIRDWYVRSEVGGGGKKFVVILASNVGGGVMEWKGPKDWAIERESIQNKKSYVRRWGYDLEILDMTARKRYAHEWRESWEKVDVLRHCMRKYPEAEWFWWLDLNTLIMEPSYSLQKHLFNRLGKKTQRDINYFNPLNITHPMNDIYLDAISKSLVGDGRPESINLILSQDCGGFNLGSFFVRRSTWTDRLLDMWWDPVLYEQRHMDWEHKEQDALEHMYTHHSWIRSHIAFIPQRMVNSFPPGACGKGNPQIHYDAANRDFLVNMAGCQWGRDCWAEMYHYRELGFQLNRPIFVKLRQWTARGFKNLFSREKPLSNKEVAPAA